MMGCSYPNCALRLQSCAYPHCVLRLQISGRPRRLPSIFWPIWCVLFVAGAPSDRARIWRYETAQVKGSYATKGSA